MHRPIYISQNALQVLININNKVIDSTCRRNTKNRVVIFYKEAIALLGLSQKGLETLINVTEKLEDELNEYK